MRYDLRMNGKHSRRSDSKDRGFTIVELIIVMVILAILIMIAIPSFQRIAINGNLKTAARDLIADFNALRQKAMAGDSPCLRPLTGECFDLTFNLGNNTYTVNPPSGLPNGVKSPASIAGDIQLTAATSPTITFLTRGTLSPPGGNIILTNSRGSTATITFNLSGRTYVQFSWQ